MADGLVLSSMPLNLKDPLSFNFFVLVGLQAVPQHTDELNVTPSTPQQQQLSFQCTWTGEPNISSDADTAIGDFLDMYATNPSHSIAIARGLMERVQQMNPVGK